jgi:hydroxymethylglutaryl-CoA reductase
VVNTRTAITTEQIATKITFYALIEILGNKSNVYKQTLKTQLKSHTKQLINRTCINLKVLKKYIVILVLIIEERQNHSAVTHNHFFQL